MTRLLCSCPCGFLTEIQLSDAQPPPVEEVLALAALGQHALACSGKLSVERRAPETATKDPTPPPNTTVQPPQTTDKQR